MVSNPYDSPHSDLATSATSARQSLASGASLIFSGFMTAGLCGLFAGGLAAALIGVLIGYRIVEAEPFVLGKENTLRMIWENVIFCAIVGGVSGGFSYSLVGVCLGLLAEYAGQNFRRVLLTAAMISCGAIGMCGGAAASFLVSGAGHDGTPIYLSSIAYGSLIGLLCGLGGGCLCGRRLAAIA